MASENPSYLNKAGKAFRDSLATVLVVLSLSTVLILATVTLYCEDKQKVSETAFKLLNLLLPVIGVWLGTVMAFYFSRENYEAAARHMMQASQPQASNSPVITTIAISYKDMPKTEIPEGSDSDQIKLFSLFPKELAVAIGKGEVNTLPRHAIIREKNKQVIYVVHPSTVADYAASGAGIEAMKKTGGLINLTIADLKKDNASLFARLQNWVTVGPNDKISDAKFVMDGKKSCRDVFVTDNGHSDGAVLAWATEGDINRAS